MPAPLDLPKPRRPDNRGYRVRKSRAKFVTGCTGCLQEIAVAQDWNAREGEARKWRMIVHNDRARARRCLNSRDIVPPHMVMENKDVD